MRINRHIIVFVVILVNFSMSQLFSQSEQINYKKEKTDLYLAASKLCWDFDYKKTFGQKRVKTMNGSEFVNNKIKTYEDNCCTQFVPVPFVSPFEYYYYLFENDDRIIKNKSNIFKVKELRQQLYDEKFDEFKKMVSKTDTEQMISHTIANATIQDYDFESNKLRLSYSASGNKNIGKSNKGLIIPKLSPYNQIFYTHYIEMTESEAKNVYDYYAENHPLNINPPFRLSTKTTYAIRIPNKENVRPYAFQCVIKKIEFYLKSDETLNPELKIGEVLFNETIQLDKYKRKFQTIINNKK